MNVCTVHFEREKQKDNWGSNSKEPYCFDSNPKKERYGEGIIERKEKQFKTQPCQTLVLESMQYFGDLRMMQGHKWSLHYIWVTQSPE